MEYDLVLFQWFEVKLAIKSRGFFFTPLIFLTIYITPASLRTNIRVHFINILVTLTLKLRNFFSICPFAKIFCLGNRRDVPLLSPTKFFATSACTALQALEQKNIRFFEKMGIFFISCAWIKCCVFWGGNVLKCFSWWFKSRKMMIWAIIFQNWANFQFFAKKSKFAQNCLFSHRFVTQNWKYHNFFSIRSISLIFILDRAKML